MNPIILAGPAVEPITLADAKAYLRLDGSEEDDLVASLIVAARVTVEQHARLRLIEQTWRYALPAWPQDRRVRLPCRPVIAVDAVRLSGADGSLDVVASGLYSREESRDATDLLVDRVPDPAGLPPRIEIDIRCGFGASAAAVPAPLVLAVRRLVAYWFEHRGDECLPGQPSIPPDVAALIAPFARPRLA